MKVLLINPRLNFTCTNPRLEAFTHQHYQPIMRDISLSLVTVAGETPPDVEVEYVDENTEHIDFDRPADLVGIHVMTPQAIHAYEIADRFRQRGVPVILGGPHPTMLPREAAAHADAIVRGEAERVWTQCIEDARRGQLKPVYAGGLSDLTKCRTPRYDLVGSRQRSSEFHNIVPVQFSRGCPHNCAYCSVSLLCGRGIRSKTSAQIAREIETIASLWTDKELVITVLDANPFVDLAQARRRIRTIASAGVKWICQADISLPDDPKLLGLLKRSDCIMIGVGFESLDPDVLEYASPWKKRRLHSYAEVLRIIRDHDIVVAGNFMLGFQRHTKEMLRRTRDFVLENDLFSQFFISTPFPGTRFYEDLVREGRLFPNLDWRYYNGFNLVYEMGMSPDEVAEDLAWLYEQTWTPEFFTRFTASASRIWRRPLPKRKGRGKSR